MLADMANEEGSGGGFNEGYNDHDDEYGDDYSGSGDHSCKFLASFLIIIIYDVVFSTVEDNEDHQTIDGKVHNEGTVTIDHHTPPATANAQRISATLVIPSLIVILFKLI